MSPTAARLPRGRHRLTRDEVVSSQRGRMCCAMADAMTEAGYVGTSVADILRRAGVSRESFYQQFSSKQSCFQATFEVATTVLLGALEGVPPDGGSPVARFDTLLGVYLDALSDHPALARVLLIEVYAAGPEALERRAATQQRFVAVVASTLEASDRRSRFACEALVAAISAMVTARLAAGDLDGLRALRRPLVRLVRQAVEGVVDA